MSGLAPAPAAPKIATALMLTVAQIVKGEATCVYCGGAACLTIATGADPMPEPVCFDHARRVLNVHAGLVDKIFGPGGH